MLLIETCRTYGSYLYVPYRNIEHMDHMEISSCKSKRIGVSEFDCKHYNERKALSFLNISETN